MISNEIIIYQADEASIRLEVKLEEETVWLNRHQISTLFDRDIKTIGKHRLRASAVGRSFSLSILVVERHFGFAQCKKVLYLCSKVCGLSTAESPSSRNVRANPEKNII